MPTPPTASSLRRPRHEPFQSPSALCGTYRPVEYSQASGLCKNGNGTHEILDQGWAKALFQRCENSSNS